MPQCIGDGQGVEADLKGWEGLAERTAGNIGILDRVAEPIRPGYNGTKTIQASAAGIDIKSDLPALAAVPKGGIEQREIADIGVDGQWIGIHPILETVAVRVGYGRIQPRRQFLEIAQTIPVRICQYGVRARGELLGIGQAVPIGIGTRIAGIPDAIVVDIRLLGVRHIGTVIVAVDDPVAVAVQVGGVFRERIDVRVVVVRVDIVGPAVMVTILDRGIVKVQSFKSNVNRVNPIVPGRAARALPGTNPQDHRLFGKGTWVERPGGSGLIGRKYRLVGVAIAVVVGQGQEFNPVVKGHIGIDWCPGDLHHAIGKPAEVEGRDIDRIIVDGFALIIVANTLLPSGIYGGEGVETRQRKA